MHLKMRRRLPKGNKGRFSTQWKMIDVSRQLFPTHRHHTNGEALITKHSCSTNHTVQSNCKTWPGLKFKKNTNFCATDFFLCRLKADKMHSQEKIVGPNHHSCGS